MVGLREMVGTSHRLCCLHWSYVHLSRVLHKVPLQETKDSGLSCQVQQVTPALNELK